MNFSFSKLKIGQRILIGFLILLVISFVAAAFNISRFSDLKTRFAALKEVSVEANLMLQIVKDISEVQRYILIFSQTGSLASMSQLKVLYAELKKDTDALQTVHSSRTKIQQLQVKQLHRSVSNFDEKIQSLQTQYFFRNDLVNQQVASKYDEINKLISELINNSNDIQNKSFLSAIWFISTNISEAEVLSTRYFSSREFALRQKTINLLTEVQNKIVSSKLKVSNPRVLQSLTNLNQLISELKVVFHQAVQADRDYLFLINIVIAGESAELSSVANTLKESSLKERESISIATEKRIKLNQQIALYASLISALLAIAIAIIMGRNISRPLMQITDTFTKLTEGKVINEVPGIERQDEIGNLAKSANVFREVNATTKKLLKQSEIDKQKLQRRERDLEKTNENLNNFTSIASHDLKSPIRGIHDLADWIQEDLGDSIPETVKHNLERIQQRIHKMETLIEDLLQYSRAGKVSTEQVLIHPVELVKEIVDFQDIPQGFNILISGNGNPFASAKTPLQTSLRNLLSNAIKHHDKQEGNIEIKVYDQGEYCVFEIQDDGPGIPPALQDRVFMLFQTMTTNKDSSGLGLAFSKRMIEAHDGKIEIISEENKRGTLFRVYWPMNAKQENANA